MTESSIQEKKFRRSIAHSLGIDDDTASRLSTGLMLKAATALVSPTLGSSEGKKRVSKTPMEVIAELTRAPSYRRRSTHISVAKSEDCKPQPSPHDTGDEGEKEVKAEEEIPPTGEIPARRRGGGDNRSVIIEAPDDERESAPSHLFDLSHLNATNNHGPLVDFGATETSALFLQGEDTLTEDDPPPEVSEPKRRRSRVPSLFSSMVGIDVTKSFLGGRAANDMTSPLSSRQSISERHELAAARRAKDFAKILMRHLQRQQAREDFGMSRVAADVAETEMEKELRRSNWTHVCHLGSFSSIIMDVMLEERNRRRLIQALSPMVCRIVLQRRKTVRLKRLMESQVLRPLTVEQIMRMSPVIAKWPSAAVLRLQEKLKPVVVPEGSVVCYAGEAVQQVNIFFPCSGHLVELPNREDLLKVAIASGHDSNNGSVPATPDRNARSTPGNSRRGKRLPNHTAAADGGFMASFGTGVRTKLAHEVLPFLFDSAIGASLCRTIGRKAAVTVLNSPTAANCDEGTLSELIDASPTLEVETKSAKAVEAKVLKDLPSPVLGLYEELEHWTVDRCFGDSAAVLLQHRRRSVRCWTEVLGYYVTFDDMNAIMSEVLSHSQRVDSVNAAKGLAKSVLAKQSKPTIEQLQHMHPLLACLTTPILQQIRNELSPHVSIDGECLVRDVLTSPKVVVVRSGLLQIEGVRKDKLPRLLQKKGPYSVTGLSTVLQTDLPNRLDEDWRLTSVGFSEYWTASNADIIKAMLRVKLFPIAVATSLDILTAQYKQHSSNWDSIMASKTPFGAEKDPQALAASTNSASYSLFCTLLNSLRTAQALQFVTEKTLHRVIKALRLKVTAPGDCICVEQGHAREGVVLLAGTISINQSDSGAARQKLVAGGKKYVPSNAGGGGGDSRSTVRTVKELRPGDALCFSETVAETLVEYSAVTPCSAVILVITKHELLDAISNGGRDYSAMYALIERCEVLTGLKSEKAAEAELAQKNLELQNQEREIREARLKEARDKSQQRVVKYLEVMEDLKRIRMDADERERLEKRNQQQKEKDEYMTNLYLSYQRITVENRVFASMGNQLMQETKNPIQQRRHEYYSNPNKLHVPLYENDPPGKRANTLQGTTTTDQVAKAVQSMSQSSSSLAPLVLSPRTQAVDLQDGRSASPGRFRQPTEVTYANGELVLMKESKLQPLAEEEGTRVKLLPLPPMTDRERLQYQLNKSLNDLGINPTLVSSGTERLIPHAPTVPNPHSNHTAGGADGIEQYCSVVSNSLGPLPQALGSIEIEPLQCPDPHATIDILTFYGDGHEIHHGQQLPLPATPRVQNETQATVSPRHDAKNRRTEAKLTGRFNAHDASRDQTLLKCLTRFANDSNARAGGRAAGDLPPHLGLITSSLAPRKQPISPPVLPGPPPLSLPSVSARERHAQIMKTIRNVEADDMEGNKVKHLETQFKLKPTGLSLQSPRPGSDAMRITLPMDVAAEDKIHVPVTSTLQYVLFPFKNMQRGEAVMAGGKVGNWKDGHPRIARVLPQAMDKPGVLPNVLGDDEEDLTESIAVRPTKFTM